MDQNDRAGDPADARRGGQRAGGPGSGASPEFPGPTPPGDAAPGPDPEGAADGAAFPVMTARGALPEPLRLLLTDFPRESWAAHPNFEGLVRFWLERHLAFRDLLSRLTADGEALLDRRLGPETYAPRLQRWGSTLLEHLHGHHQIEDHHYFPLLAAAEPRLERGFDMLERDHQALDPALAAFAGHANAALRAAAGESADAALRGAVPAVMAEVAGLARLLDRHLTDEEELVVPVVLRAGIR